jgi:hypothetical protein
MFEPTAQLERYSQHLEAGNITALKVVGVTLDILAEATDRAALWASAPKVLKDAVMDYLARKGPGGVPPKWVIGVNDPEWRAAVTARRQAVATELFAGQV